MTASLIAILLVSAPAQLDPPPASTTPEGAAAPVTPPEAKVDPTANDIVIERVVAVVNKDVVLLSEVEEVLDELMRADPPLPGTDIMRAREERRREVVEGLIAEKLLEQQIRTLRIDVSPDEVEAMITDKMQQFGLNEAQLEQALQQQGLTLDEYREGVRKQLLKAKIIHLKVKNRVQVTDQDVKSTHATRAARASRDFRVRARHIVFIVRPGADENEVKKKADAALARIRGGEPFAKVAEEVSEGPSASMGGDLGTFGKGEMMVEFERAAFAAEPRVPTEPVRTQVGWHLIYVEERVVPKTAPLDDDGTENLRQEMYEREVERAFRRYIDELKQKSYIDIRSS